MNMHEVGSIVKPARKWDERNCFNEKTEGEVQHSQWVTQAV